MLKGSPLQMQVLRGLCVRGQPRRGLPQKHLQQDYPRGPALLPGALGEVGASGDAGAGRLGLLRTLYRYKHMRGHLVAYHMLLATDVQGKRAAEWRFFLNNRFRPREQPQVFEVAE